MKYFSGPADGQQDPLFEFAEFSSLEKAIEETKRVVEDWLPYVILKGENQQDAVIVAQISVSNVRQVKVEYAPNIIEQEG